MRRHIDGLPVLSASVNQLLRIFLTKKYISTPGLFGLCDFSANELLKNSYQMTGDDFYCLYEKNYRLAGSDSNLNLKNYFSQGEFISNGVDLTGARICTVLSRFCSSKIDSSLIYSIELFLDESLDFGSLVINDFLELRFGKTTRPKHKKKFHLTGISTDYELPLGSAERKINTRGARVMKKKISFCHALLKFAEEPAVKNLVMCVRENLPHAILDEAGEVKR